MGKQKGEVKIVMIPADLHEEIQERTIPYTEETEVSCVQDVAKVRFATRSGRNGAHFWDGLASLRLNLDERGRLISESTFIDQNRILLRWQ